MKLKIILIAIVVLAALVVAAARVPLYKASAVTCSGKMYHRKSLYKGDSAEEIKKEVDALNTQMNLRFCGAQGEVRYELYLF